MYKYHFYVIIILVVYRPIDETHANASFDSILYFSLQHYDAIMKYIWQGPILVDVHMHKPLTNSRNFMDSLLAFWPGVQVKAVI